MLSCERPGQRTVIRFGYHAFPHPLPKLSLRGPKLLAITADYQGRLLLFLLFLVFVYAHLLFPPCPETNFVIRSYSAPQDSSAIRDPGLAARPIGDPGPLWFQQP